ncbi:MAG TPA: substrate-binding domain-containing protein [Acholeplasmataceae bacterium]|jgi:LacI family transcriptional regulator|nr:substrate-binding domain-containing protein [Acholeplasmataceae bacterium]
MSITIKKIAELSNVSRGTVDRVIHNRGGVSEENRKKIEYIIKKYNYKSNRHAQGLVNSKKTFRVGVVINNIGNEFFDYVLEGLMYEANKSSNINLIIKNFKGYDEEKQIEAIDSIMKENIQALIINPFNTKKVIEKLSQIKIPIVLMNNDIDIEKLAFVGCDYYNSGQLSGDIANIALPSGGNVAIIVGSYKIRGHVERIEGFKDAFKSKGKQVQTFENQDDDEQSYLLTKDIILSNGYDLIYYAAAGISGGLKAIAETGSKIKVITVDETKAVRKALAEGKILATITQQPYKQGSRSLQIVRDYLVYNSKPLDVQNMTGNRVHLKNMKFPVEK